MAAIPLPSQEYLRECFAYNPHTGALIWRWRPRGHFVSVGAWRSWNARMGGAEADRIRADGKYRRAAINDQSFLSHRIIWKMMTGEDAPLIDHADRDGTNNKWLNLRKATGHQNNLNSSVRKSNVTGLKGVTKRRSRYIAQIKIKEKTIYLGMYQTAEAAHAAYCKAARNAFDEFWVDGSATAKNGSGPFDR